MPAIAAGAALIGGGVQAVGQYQAGQDARKQANYNAQIAQQEGWMIKHSGEREADIIGQNQVLNEYRQRKQQAYDAGAMTAGYAGAGVKVGTGSPLNAMVDSLANSELEIAIGAWNAKTQADTVRYNAKMGMMNKNSQAEMLKKYGQSAATNSLFQAGGTLLQSGSTAYNRLSNEKFAKS